MVDYTNSKIRSAKTYPIEAKETTSLMSRIETTLTPEMLISRYLHGLNMEDFTSEELQTAIMMAMNEVEIETGLTLNKVQYDEALPFDEALYRNFVHVKTNHGPILSIESFDIEASNETRIYPLPVEWIDTRLAHKRQLNIIPLLTATALSGANTALGGVTGPYLFVRALGGIRWMPSFWKIRYTAGVCKEDGKMPIIINDIIGMTVAIEILSLKQNLIRNTSQSLSQDGLSQSSGGHGNQTHQPRIDLLKEKKAKQLSRIRSLFFQKYFVGNF